MRRCLAGFIQPHGVVPDTQPSECWRAAQFPGWFHVGPPAECAAESGWPNCARFDNIADAFRELQHKNGLFTGQICGQPQTYPLEQNIVTDGGHFG